MIPGLVWGKFWSDFYRYPYIHSLLNGHYRFFKSQPDQYEVGITGKIPYQKYPTLPQTIDSLDIYSLETTLDYTYIAKEIKRHNYFIEQSWHGNYLHIKAGYGYTHQVNPLASFQHDLPLSLGGLVGNWELTVFGKFSWSSTFRPLLGGNIAYLFYTKRQTQLQEYFSSPPNFFIPNRIDLTIYQTSRHSFMVKQIYQFNITDYPNHLRFFISWEIFPLRVGLAFSFSRKDWIQATSHIRYRPRWGFDHSLEVGIIHYHHSVYFKQIKENNLKTDIVETGKIEKIKFNSSNE